MKIQDITINSRRWNNYTIVYKVNFKDPVDSFYTLFNDFSVTIDRKAKTAKFVALNSKVICSVVQDQIYVRKIVVP